MKTTLLILFLSSFLNGVSQPINSDKDNYNLKGSIESVQSTRYYALIDTLKGMKKGDFYPTRQKDVFESKLLSIYYFNTPENSLCLFDKAGNIKTILYFQDKAVKLYFVEIRTEINDTLSYETFYLPDDISINYSVYSKNKCINKRVVVTENDDTLFANYIYSNGRIIKDELSNNQALQVSCHYKFNLKGEISDKILISEYNKDTLMIHKYSYNKYGDIETETGNSNKKFEYEYDVLGNWIICYEYNENHKIEAIIERKIKYY